jgi:acetyl-CoA C-acetyltransferase
LGNENSGGLMMDEAIIVGVARTPVGKFRGALSSLEVPDLGAITLKAVVDRAAIKPEQVDEIIMGNLFGADWGNPARVAALRAGFPISVPGFTLDRQCSSALTALGLASALIQSGSCETIIAAGIESYSQQPFLVKRPETAYPGILQVLEYKPSHPSVGNPSMLEIAENMAKKWGISREACDAFALKSHKNAAAAWAAGCFDDHVIPVTITQKKGDSIKVSMDECVRPNASIEALSKLKPVLYANGVVTAGNSSPMNDASSAVLVMSREKAKNAGLKPLAVVRHFASAGCEPVLMGIGPVYSTRKLMEKYGYSLKDFDYIELNEAFASQSLSVIKELGLDPDKVNVQGGAIAIGHPNGASGGVLIGRMISVLRHHNAHRGLITFCCGGGQGFSLVLERDETCL